MPDFPDFENNGHDSGMSMHRLNSRPGLEPIPAFEAASSVPLQIEVLKETHDEIQRVILDNEWEGEEGLRTVLLAGLGYLDARQRVESINRAAFQGDHEAARQQMDQMVKDLASYHQQYSVMKFKAFKLYKVNQVLEFNISGLRATERMWEGWAARMRKQHAELQAEVLRLRSLMSEFQLDWDSPLSREVEAGLAPVPETELLDFTVPEAETQLLDEPAYPPFERPTLWQRIKRFFGGS